MSCRLSPYEALWTDVRGLSRGGDLMLVLRYVDKLSLVNAHYHSFVSVNDLYVFVKHVYSMSSYEDELYMYFSSNRGRLGLTSA